MTHEKIIGGGSSGIRVRKFGLSLTGGRLRFTKGFVRLAGGRCGVVRYVFLSGGRMVAARGVDGCIVNSFSSLSGGAVRSRLSSVQGGIGTVNNRLPVGGGQNFNCCLRGH